MNDSNRNTSSTTANMFEYYQAPSYDNDIFNIGEEEKKSLEIKLSTVQQATLNEISEEDIYTSVFAPIQSEIVRNIEETFLPVETGEKLVVIIMRKVGEWKELERPIRFTKMGHRWIDAVLSSNEKLLDYQLLFHGFFGNEFEGRFDSYSDQYLSMEARLMLIRIIKNENTKVPPSFIQHHEGIWSQIANTDTKRALNLLLPSPEDKINVSRMVVNICMCI